MMILRHFLAVMVLPFTVTVMVPAALLRGDQSASSTAARVPGLILMAAGLGLVIYTVALFGSRGRGTLAPWDPPRRLVVTGIYRHVRNPMISGVLLILVGESLVFSSTAVGTWALVFFILNAAYIPLLEEPALDRRFGAEFAAYRRHVPRWVPRLSPWYPTAAPGPDEGAGSKGLQGTPGGP